MPQSIDFHRIKEYFNERLENFGTTARGADWNSPLAQESRFEQLLKIVNHPDPFTIMDYGCGYGALISYMENNGFQFTQYNGFDILESMVQKAQEVFRNRKDVFFTSNLDAIPVVDYVVASGVFNIRLQTSYEEWTQYVTACLAAMNQSSRLGFSCNFLTKYSDAERMLPHLYYADPCFIFDYCKTHFSRNVAILHDYNLYDFTILVRKNP